MPTYLYRKTFESKKLNCHGMIVLTPYSMEDYFLEIEDELIMDAISSGLKENYLVKLIDSADLTKFFLIPNQKISHCLLDNQAKSLLLLPSVKKKMKKLSSDNPNFSSVFSNISKELGNT